MSKQILPDGAYAALEGLKAQAAAAMMMLPGMSKGEGKKALAAAHAQIAAKVAERSGNYQRRDSLLVHVESCAIRLDSIQPTQA